MREEALVIQPSRGWRHINFKELWLYRELLFFFTWRDIAVRYKQTFIGVAWAVLQPLLTMLVFSLFFGKLAKMPSDGVPYPIFVYTGLLPWTLFSQSLGRAAASVVANGNLIKKVYFPRLITPLAASLSAVVDFAVSFFILIIMMAWFRIFPGLLEWLMFIVLVLMTVLCSVGIGFWFAAINAMYRDVQHAMPFVIQMGMFVTPVIYPVSLVPEQYAWLLYLNPMAGIIEAFRAVLLGTTPVPWLGLMFSGIVTFMFFVSGLYFFRKMERTFADVL